jgi:hypothetical protein
MRSLAILKAKNRFKLVINKMKLIISFLAGAIAAWLILHALHI